jgi:tetratricopeptide (TPR) repeat protein
LGGCAQHWRTELAAAQREAWLIESALEAQMAEQSGARPLAVRAWRRAVALDPGSAEARLRLATAYWYAGHPESALKTVERARRDLGDAPGLLMLHGRLASFFGRPEQARALLRQAWELDPERADVAAMLARMEDDAGRPERALELIDSAVVLGLEEPDLQIHRVRLLQDLGRSGEAFDTLEGLARAQPGDARLLAEYLRVGRDREELPRVRAGLESIARQHRGGHALLLLAELEIATSDLEGAEAYLLRLESHGEELREQGRSLRVETLLAAGEPQRASAAIEELAQDGWDPQELRWWRAQALAGVGEVDAALALVDEARDAGLEGPWDLHALGILQDAERWPELSLRLEDWLDDPVGLEQATYAAIEAADFVTARRRLERMYARDPMRAAMAEGSLAAAEGDFARAVGGLQETIREHPAELAPRQTLARLLDENGLKERALEVLHEARLLGLWSSVYEAVLLSELGREDEAEALGRRLLRDRPDDPVVLNYVGYTWAERGQHLDDAERLIRRALEADPWNAAYLDSLGWVLRQAGDPLSGLPHLHRAAKLEPMDPEIAEHLGDAYLDLGRVEEARAWYGLALTQAQARPDQDVRANRLQEKLEEP